MTPPPLIVTMGDPSGIGPEIVVKALAGGQAGPCVVAGLSAVIRDAVASLGLGMEVCPLSRIEEATGTPGRIELLRPAVRDPSPSAPSRPRAGARPSTPSGKGSRWPKRGAPPVS